MKCKDCPKLRQIGWNEWLCVEKDIILYTEDLDKECEEVGRNGKGTNK